MESSVPAQRPPDPTPGSWSFSRLGEEFDLHVRKHLPGYDQLQALVVSAASWRLTDESTIVDVGCSTGYTLEQIVLYNTHKVQAWGIDPDPGMIGRARERFGGLPEHRRPVAVEGSLLDFTPPCKADVLIALFVLQFVDPTERLKALRRLDSWLRPGALVIIAEKCEAANVQAADLWSGLYSDWKLQSGISADEILQKWARLRGQLIPWPSQRYVEWAEEAELRGDLFWSWGPFRAWAWWKDVR